MPEITNAVICSVLRHLLRVFADKGPMTFALNDQCEEYVPQTEYLVEGDDTLDLWSQYHQIYGYTWKQMNPGGMETIGWLEGNRPVCVEYHWNRIGGRMVCFYNCCSQIKDSVMVEEHLKKRFPGVPETNLKNFHNCIRELGIPEPPGKQERAKAHREFIRKIWRG